MDQDELLLRKMDELLELLYSDDTYSLIAATAILRLLLLDETPLIHAVNRRHKLKLRFSVSSNDVQDYPDKLPQPYVHIVNPLAITGHERILNLEQFLGLKVVRIEGETFRVRELIQNVAHVLGGVHLGTPKDKEELLQRLQSLSIASDFPLLFDLIRNIGFIVLEALRELRNVILRVKEFENKPGLSVHLCAALLPIDGDNVNYVLDIGVERNRNRLSFFIDSTHHLTLRFINSSGEESRIRGTHCRWLYDRPIYLNFEVSSTESAILLTLSTELWDYARKVSVSELDLEDMLHFVLGSDVSGSAKTHLMMYEKVVCKRMLTESEREQMRDYFYRNIADGKYQQGIYFKSDNKDNKFLYSSGHPNFPEVPS